ncbi:class II aldolase/adducin family protein [Frankia sp. QA3]|uniref:class II aldolase/adducin family protein n=1 Tax=Frankia sp. QA3 TaxID=710111 RepID=UPI000269CEB7|nr:class II aldolase/adducin family protein [Frankia sp. QA3]EIV96246.1 ribulose-5-phosphate 4-epimerase-like epimerase or aldolase [Frankia sp. QA3]
MATSTETKPSEASKQLDLAEADEAIRAELIVAVQKLHRAQVLPFSVNSNGSVRLPSGDGILVSSYGLKADIGVDDFGVVDFEGRLVRGALGPDVVHALAFHLEVYRARPEVDTVLHTHSPAATSFAVAGKPLPLHYEPLVFLGQRGDIPVTKYGDRTKGSKVSDEVAARLAEHPDTKAILLANHGLLVWGSRPVTTAEFLITVEEAATIIIGAAALGGSRPFPISYGAE